MTPIKCNKKFIVIMYAFELLLGVYIASLRLYDFDFTALSDIFLFARETDYADLEENILNMQSVISVLNIIISIPLLSSIFSKNYSTKCSYCVTRKGRYSRFYFSEALNLLKYTFFCELLYSLGIIIYCVIKCSDLVLDAEILRSFSLSVINSTLLLFAFVLFGAVICVLVGEKGGMILSVTVSAILFVMLFVLPIECKQFNPFAMYFVSEFPSNGEIFTHPIFIYYLEIFIIITAILFAGLKLLKKKDVL